MATSFGAAAAQGLESGFGLGMRAQQMRDTEEQRRLQQQQQEQERSDRLARESKQDARIASQDKRLAAADDRQRRMDEMKMLDDELGGLEKEGAALWSQFGGYDKVPEEVRGQYTQRLRDARARRAAARQKFYQPTVEEQRKDAAEKWARIQSGQMTLDDLSDDDLYRTLTVQTGRPMSDFLRGKNGEPSPIEQAGMDLDAGMKAGNQDLVLKAANVLLAPELQQGVGEEGPDGSEIVGKRIVRIVPHPNDPQQFVPIVEVEVKREDGAIGRYTAPITEDRSLYSRNQQAMPKAISLDAALERAGQLQTLAAAVNRPDIRKRVDKGGAGPAKATSDEFLAALSAAGVTPPKKQISRERVDLGDRVLEREVDASGNIIKETPLRKGPAPTKGEGPTAEERNASAADRRLDRAVKEGLITPDEAREQRRKAALGGGGKGQMTSPADLFKAENTLRDEHAQQSKTFVKIRDAYTKVQAAGKNPNAASDIALIFSYMRILDPDSVVREGEFAVAEKARGVPDSVLNTYNRLIKGERLNDEQRAKFIGEAKKVYQSQRQAQDKLDENYTRLAERYGLDPQNVVQQIGLTSDPAKPRSKAEYDKLPPGAEFIAPDGSLRRKP